MFYRGQLCKLYFQILDHKQSRRPPDFYRLRSTTKCQSTEGQDTIATQDDAAKEDKSGSLIHSILKLQQFLF